MKINKERALNIIGIILIMSLISRIITLSIYGDPVHLFWLSNHLPLLLGISILMRNSFWILAELSLIFVGEVGWSIDYLSKIIFDNHIAGSTTYMFVDEISKQLYISSLTHLIVVPLGVAAFLILGKKAKNAWKGAALHATILIPFIIHFGKDYNLNCFFESCISWLPTIKFFPIIFPISYILICVIPIAYLLNKLIKN